MMATVNTTPQSVVQLYIQCFNLKDMDVLSKSDPICEVLVKGTKVGEWVPIGRTEVVKNNLSPKFQKTIEMPYFFEQKQPLLFRVYDMDFAYGNLADNDFLGSMECTLGEIVGGVGSQISRKLKNKQGEEGRNGSMIVVCEEKNSNPSLVVKLQMRGIDLAKKDFFGKSDPYAVFHRRKPDGSWHEIFRTETIKNTLNPTWKEILSDSSILCNNNLDTKIRIEVWDYDLTSKDDRIGNLDISLNEISQSFRIKEPVKLVHPKGKPKDVGKLAFDFVEMKKNPTFLDFLAGGCEINVVFAVDFTASNKNPTQPDSLHFICPQKYNEYQSAIMSVGEILSYYDSDRLFPAYGFGARLPDGSVSHCFAMNGDPSNPYCPGVGGVLQSYAQTLSTVQLYGPTNFADIITLAAKTASQAVSQESQRYFVLLMLTDGEITDMARTVEAIVQASHLPLSIVIVGVGSADFSMMRQLDADDSPLTSGCIRASRDIVQFVEFRQFAGNTEALAREVLAEIPAQLLSFMKIRGIVPNPPRKPPQQPQQPQQPQPQPQQPQQPSPQQPPPPQ